MNKTWYEKGFEQGQATVNTTWFERGIEKGIEKGRQEGIEKGRRESLRELLEERLGALSPAVLAQLEKLPVERLQFLFRAASKAQSLEELGLEK
jgi:flagellar biosynthesis/type III secretory pathway protein FliH